MSPHNIAARLGLSKRLATRGIRAADPHQRSSEQAAFLRAKALAIMPRAAEIYRRQIAQGLDGNHKQRRRRAWRPDGPLT